MKIINSTPKADGYRMPAEYEPHAGTIMIWPVRSGSWPYAGSAAKQVFARIASVIAEQEDLFMLTDEKHKEEAEQMLGSACQERMHVCVLESDDAWARDVAPTYVVATKTSRGETLGNNVEPTGESTAPIETSTGKVRGINWEFNAWGGTYDGLYQHWEKDNALAKGFLERTGTDCYDAAPFVLEGGSIHSDGEGTILVTEACLLSQGRNPHLTKAEIEETLKTYLGAEKVIWLPRGIYEDETNEHVDNVCAFVKAAEVVLAWTDDETDPQFAYSKACLDVLEQETDAKGRSFVVHKMLIPKNPVCVSQEDLDGYVFEEAEDTRVVGERLAASYVNFYIANGVVLVPQFLDDHDALAVELLSSLFPERKVVPIYARDIIVGGGNIHCITQQIPAGNP